MANTGRKSNNELYELNDLLLGVDAAEDSLEDILAEIYGNSPGKTAPKPPKSRQEETLPPAEEAPVQPPAPAEEAPVQPPAPAEEAPMQPPAPRTPGAAFVLPLNTEELTDSEQTESRLVLEAEDFPAPEAPARPRVTPLPRKKKSARPPEEGKKRGRVLFFRKKGEIREEPPRPEPQPDTPSAWVEPDSTELPPALLEAVFADHESLTRPDGFTPEKREDLKKNRRSTIQREEDYRLTTPDGEQEEQEEEAPQPWGLGRLRARANAFADSMFSQDAETDTETELAEKFTPGTDVETISAPVRRPRRPKREQPPAPDIPPRKLAHLYLSGLNFMSRRVFLLGLLSVIGCYITLGAELSLPLPQLLLTQENRVICLLLVLGWCVVFSLDVIWMGFETLQEARFTLHTTASLAVVCTVVDALACCLLHRPGGEPYCAPACLLLFCLTWGAYDKKLANYRACRQAGLSQKPWRITKDEQLWNSRDTFVREQGTSEGFGSQFQMPNGSEKLQCRVAPVLTVAAIALSVLASVGRGNAGQLLWCLSAILIACSPLSTLLCYGQPWLHLTRRLERCSATVAGWPGVESGSGEAGILIEDNDLFPAGVKSAGPPTCYRISTEKLVGCAASLIRASGSSLTGLFDGLVRTYGGFYRNVEEFHCHEAGGLSGTIRGEQILLGTASFMKMMDILMPEDANGKNAVYCAIDGTLKGVFRLNYGKPRGVRASVSMLLRGGIVPVLVTRDFNLNPALLRRRMKLPVERMEYPSVDRRLELTDPDQPHAPVLTALLNRDGLEPYAETVVGCRRLRSAVVKSTLLCLVASLIGLLLSFYLTSVSAYSSLSPVNMLAFLVLWLIPTLLLTGTVNRY